LSNTSDTILEQPRSIRPFAATASKSAIRRPRNTPSRDEILEHYLKRMAPEVAASFTEAQRDAIKSILGTRGMTKHAVEIRRSIPLSKWRFYTVFLMGREHRSLRHLDREGALSRPFNLLVYACLAALISAPVLGVILAFGL
jgi:hypothetical protein